MIRTCLDCKEEYTTDDDYEKRCDTCSIRCTFATRPIETPIADELAIADKWTKETIKRGWKQAAADSRAKIMLDYNLRKKHN